MRYLEFQKYKIIVLLVHGQLDIWQIVIKIALLGLFRFIYFESTYMIIGFRKFY